MFFCKKSIDNKDMLKYNYIVAEERMKFKTGGKYVFQQKKQRRNARARANARTNI